MARTVRNQAGADAEVAAALEQKGKRPPPKRGRGRKKKLSQQLLERMMQQRSGRRPKAGGRKSGHWVRGAIGRPGQLHRDLGVPEGQKIPQARLKAALAGKFGPKVKKRAELAKTLAGMRR